MTRAAHQRHSSLGFYIANASGRITVRHPHVSDIAWPHWTHDRRINAFTSRFRRLIVVKVRHALNRLLQSGRNLSPVLKDIGEHLLDSTQQRFARQTAPDGSLWQALSPQYQSAKKRNENKILMLDGHLSGTLRWQVSGNTLLFGSDRVYAAIHQFGGKTRAHTIRPRSKKALAWPGGKHPVKKVEHPGSDIPARPFLGLSADDERDIVDIVHDHLQDAWTGPGG